MTLAEFRAARPASAAASKAPSGWHPTDAPTNVSSTSLWSGCGPRRRHRRRRCYRLRFGSRLRVSVHGDNWWPNQGGVEEPNERDCAERAHYHCPERRCDVEHRPRRRGVHVVWLLAIWNPRGRCKDYWAPPFEVATCEITCKLLEFPRTAGR